MNVFVQFFLLIGTSLVWGVTNPLIKNKGVFIITERKTSIFGNLFGRIFSLFLNWKIVLPIAVNQLGSILFFMCIKYTAVSIAVPVVNSLTLVFTTITSTFLGEKLTLNQIKGSVLIVLGVIVCILSK